MADSSTARKKTSDKEKRELKEAILIRKIKKREAKDIIDVICKQYDTTVEAARCPMKGSRKVTYLLSYGTVDLPECFYLDKKRIVLIPNGYTVAFEAHSQVWIARILFQRRNATSPYVPTYDVIPVDKDGKEQEELSSKPQDNTSAAFRIAIRNKWGTDGINGLHRPNGRLFIGVFYDSVQYRLRKNLIKQIKLGAMDGVSSEVKRRARDWIARNETTEERTSQIPSNGSYGQLQQAAFPTNDRSNISSVGKGLVQSVLNYPAMFPTQDLLMTGQTLPHTGTQNFAASNQFMPSTLGTGAPMFDSNYLMTDVNSTMNTLPFSMPQQQQQQQDTSDFTKTSRTQPKKRGLVTNGKALIRAATAPVQQMEEELESVFKRVLASIEENPGSRDEEQDMSMRLLKKLDHLKKMIVHTSKRRRTTAQNSATSFEPNDRGFNPYGMDYQGNSNSGRSRGSTPSLFAMQNASSHSLLQGSKGSDGNDMDDNSYLHNATDIPDVDFNELLGQVDNGSVAPVVVGCNMTHEGLYLTLDVNKKNGLTERELKTAYKCLRIPATSSLVKKTLQACDKNGDGRISMQEFLEYLKDREKELKKMFDQMDLTRDGFVTLEELKTARSQGLFEASDDEIQTLINWMDSQEYGWRDGKIEFEEFRTSMLLLPPATSIQEIIDLLNHRTNELKNDL